MFRVRFPCSRITIALLAGVELFCAVQPAFVGAGTRPSTAPATRPVADDVASRAAALPRTWAGGSYRLNKAGKPVGAITHRTDRAEQDGQPALKMTDVIELDDGAGGQVITTYTTVCRADGYLTPLYVSAEGDAKSGGLGAVDLRFDGMTAVGSLRGRPHAAPAAAPVVTEWALFRLVTLMPLRPGAELRFNLFQSSEGRPLGATELRCVGPERVRVAGRDYNAWRFEHTGATIRPTTYWVNSDRFFLKALLPGDQEWVYAPNR